MAPDVPEGDCFQGLHADLTTNDKVANLFGDVHKYLKDTWAKGTAFDAFESDAFKGSLKTYIDALGKVKNNNVSTQFKMAAGKERARLQDLLRLANLHTKYADMTPEEAKAELAYLEKRMGYAKVQSVFTKYYPINVSNPFQKVKAEVTGHFVKQIEVEQLPKPIAPAEGKTLQELKDIILGDMQDSGEEIFPETYDWLNSLSYEEALKSAQIVPEAPKTIPLDSEFAKYFKPDTNIDNLLEDYGAQFTAGMSDSMKKQWLVAFMQDEPLVMDDIEYVASQAIDDATKNAVVDTAGENIAMQWHEATGAWNFVKDNFTSEMTDFDTWGDTALKGFLGDVYAQEPDKLPFASMDSILTTDHDTLVGMAKVWADKLPAIKEAYLHPLYAAMVETKLAAYHSWTDEMYYAYGAHFGIPIPLNSTNYQKWYAVQAHYNALTSKGIDKPALLKALLGPPAEPLQPVVVVAGSKNADYQTVAKAYQALSKAGGNSVKPALDKIDSPLAFINAKMWGKSTPGFGTTKEKIVQDLAAKVNLLKDAQPFKLPDSPLVKAPELKPPTLLEKYPEPYNYIQVTGTYYPDNPSVWSGDIVDHWLASHQIDPKDYPDIADKVLLIQGKTAADIQFEKDKAEALINPVFHKMPTTDPRYFTPEGMHTKILYLDQGDNIWMAKPMSESFRIHTEDASLKIGKLFGFREPDSRVETLDGKLVHIQKLFPGVVGNLQGVPPEELTDRQLQTVFNEHMLDWALANHDTYTGNLLRLDDGSIVGIDKGQAYKFFGKDKLAIGYLPPGNGAPVYYDQVYKAILSHKVDQPTARKLITKALQRATSMQKVSDEKYRELLEYAFHARPASTMEGGKAAYIQSIIDRKNNLVNDLTAFYKDIYTDAGYTWDIDLTAGGAKIVMGDTELYAGYSQELLDHVQLVGGHGMSTFFATDAFEGSHEFLWEEIVKDQGKPVRQLSAEVKLREDADKLMTKFLQEQPGINVSKTVQNVSGVSAAEMTGSFGPQADQYWNSILAGIKTVQTHATDGAYNTQTLANLAQTQKLIKLDLSHFASGSFIPDEAKKLGAEGMAAYKDMLETYDTAIADILEQKDLGKTIPKNLYAKVLYTPKTVAKPVTEVPKVEATYKVTKIDNGMYAGKFDPKTGLTTYDPSLSPKRISGQRFLIQLDSDTSIEYNPWAGNGVSEQGIMRLHIKNYDGDIGQLDQFHALLDTVGISIEPADETHLELMYWRQYLGSIRPRKVEQSRFAKVFKYYDDRMTANLQPEEELRVIKDALAEYYPRDLIDGADITPHFGHGNPLTPDTMTGMPYWNRFDIQNKDLYGLLSGQFPALFVTSGGSRADIAISGGFFSNEERLRFLHLWTGGSPDADITSGGANYIFTRMKFANADVFFSPDVMKRTTTFSINGDAFGRISTRDAQAPWDPAAWKSMTSGQRGLSGGNETDIKNSVSFLDDIEVFLFTNATERANAIDFYKAQGITEVRGLPIEQRFVMASDKEQALKRAWDKWKELNT